MPSVYTTLSNDKISQPEVRYLSLPDRRTLREYSLVPKIIETESEDPRVDNLLFFRTCNAMKPDGSKYAMAMGFLPQINILDLASGKIGYYRLKGGAGVGSLLGKPNIKTYHSQPVCDDNYIYSLYYGFVDDRYAAADLEEKVSNFPHLVHVYDWDGNLVKVFDLGQRVNSISVSDGVLWAVNYYTEELWSCDISDKL